MLRRRIRFRPCKRRLNSERERGRKERINTKIRVLKEKNKIQTMNGEENPEKEEERGSSEEIFKIKVLPRRIIIGRPWKRTVNVTESNPFAE